MPVLMQSSASASSVDECRLLAGNSLRVHSSPLVLHTSDIHVRGCYQQATAELGLQCASRARQLTTSPACIDGTLYGVLFPWLMHVVLVIAIIDSIRVHTKCYTRHNHHHQQTITITTKQSPSLPTNHHHQRTITIINKQSPSLPNNHHHYQPINIINEQSPSSSNQHHDQTITITTKQSPSLPTNHHHHQTITITKQSTS